MTKPASGLACCTVLLLAMAGARCAEHIPEPVIVPSLPHVSWLIASHRENENERTVCQSDPRTECAILPGAADARRMATVHLYLHPSTVDTRYVGTMRVEFLSASSAKPYDSKIDSLVKAGSPPVGISVTGLVTSTPGVYSMTIALTATSSAPGTGQDIRVMVPMAVR